MIGWGPTTSGENVEGIASGTQGKTTDTGGTDTHTCPGTACYGCGEATSVATFVDGQSGSDSFTASKDVCPTPEATGDLGLCLREGVS